MGLIKKSGLGNDASFSARYLDNRSTVPQVSAIMANSISQERRVILSDEVDQGRFANGSQQNYSHLNGRPDVATDNGNVICSVGFKKNAQSFGGGGGGFSSVS